MRQTSHKPGFDSTRSFANYTEYQDALWEALDDFYYADVGGYGHTRLPTPGKIIEPTLSHQLEFDGWKELVIKRWDAEAKRDKQTKGIQADEISDNLWYYRYERFLDAEKYYVQLTPSKEAREWGNE